MKRSDANIEHLQEDLATLKGKISELQSNVEELERRLNTH
jgi:prefoldin subunit 5